MLFWTCSPIEHHNCTSQRKKYSAFAVLKTLATENCRSPRGIVVPLERLNIVNGLNASGEIESVQGLEGCK